MDKEEDSNNKKKDFWVCHVCRRENTAKFCPDCGAKRKKQNPEN